MRIPHAIPYQGSKRSLASAILHYFPPAPSKLIEPFAGAAAVSIAAVATGKVERIVLNDINEPLMRLWKRIVDSPELIAAEYAHLWKAQLANPRTYYDSVRSEFNLTREPRHFLYLLARCVKAAVRYNSHGDFNQSPDNRRLGMNPKTMRQNIFAVSRLFAGKVSITSGDYRNTFEGCTTSDLVYMDPPYQGVCTNRDSRYSSFLRFDDFTAALDALNKRRISYILSYDGRTGEKSHGKVIPEELSLVRIEINAGRSSQATLLGRNDITYESIYISPALVKRIGKIRKRQLTLAPEQLSLSSQYGRREAIQGIP